MRVIIKDNAKEMLRETALWYKNNLGRKAKDKFVHGIMSAIRLLEDNPRMGRLVDKKRLALEIEERIFVEHKAANRGNAPFLTCSGVFKKIAIRREK